MGNHGSNQEQRSSLALWHFGLRRFLATAAEGFGKLALHLLSAQPKETLMS